MKPAELRNLSAEELQAKHQAFLAELYNLNYQRRSGRVEKPHRFAQVRHDIARIKTILREKETHGNKEGKEKNF